jgi:uncharacterized protein (UPF0305 family)
MTNPRFIETRIVLSLLLYQMVYEQSLSNLQKELLDTKQELIESQKKIIRLQDKVESMTPETPDDEKAFWHIASGGMLSTEAAKSDDLAVVERFKDWNIEFAKTYIKPYVNPKVYSECLNQMTRGLSERIAELKTKQEVDQSSSVKTKKVDQPAENRVIQLSLIQDAT